MRLFKPVLGVLAVVLLLLSRPVASAGIDELPPCATDCLMQALAVNHCAPSDLHCQCSGENSLKGMSACVVDNCTITEAILFSRATAARCNLPHNNHHVSMKAAVVGSIVAAYVMIGLRVVSRACTAQRFWWDDWCHIFTGALCGPLFAFAVLCINGGMGYHSWDIDFSPLSKARDLSFWYYMCQIFWALVIYFIKMSILALYIRIFPHHVFYRYCIATMILVTISVLIIVPMVIWQCNPMDAIWNLQRKNASCLSLAGVAYANAGVNIATEVVVLILPVPLLLKLRVSISSKIALFALFGCGILVIGVASARVPTLEHVEAVNDPTYLNNGVFYWTCAETAVAHLCAAAPAIRPLYLKLKHTYSRRRGDEEMTIPNASRTENDFWNSDPSTSKSRTGSEDPMMGSSWIRGWLQRPHDEGTVNTVNLSDLSSSQESSEAGTADYSGHSGGRTQS